MFKIPGGVEDRVHRTARYRFCSADYCTTDRTDVRNKEPHFGLYYQRLTKGHRLYAGQEVRVSIGAANHDPKRFVHPEKLILSKSEGTPLAFGYGLHSCVGAALARMEASAALRGLLLRTPDMRLQTDIFEYAPVYFLRTLKSLSIAVCNS